jgi:hypothetical protein
MRFFLMELDNFEKVSFAVIGLGLVAMLANYFIKLF